MKKQIFLIALFVIGTLAISSSAMAISITVTNDTTTLTNTILGSGITLVGTPTNGGSSVASGTFTGGLSSGIGIESGIILTTGQAADAVGPNQNGSVVETLGGGGSGDDTTTDLGLAGDADLTTLAGYDTFDAIKLEFDFTTTSGDLYFNYVFASEEYIDWVGTQFNDVFGFFVDGFNIGLVPGTTDPVSVNTVNPVTNSAFYNNNINPATYDIEYDGFTDVFTASIIGLAPGTHHIKLAIADGSDHILDAAVFIEAGSFVATVPEPSTLLLFGTGLIGIGVFRRKFRG